MIDDLKGMERFFTIPFEQVKENLRKILEEQGVAKKIAKTGPSGATSILSCLTKTASYPQEALTFLSIGKTISETLLKR